MSCGCFEYRMREDMERASTVPAWHMVKLNKSWLLIPLYNLRQVASSLSSYFLMWEVGVNNTYLRVTVKIQRD